MKTNFRDDVRIWLLGRLRDLGHTPAPSLATDHLGRLYFNVFWRTIHPRPSTVHISETLRAKLASPQVAEVVRDSVREIVCRAERGESLRPFQSTGVADVDRQDQLLNDWRIHHLHVGPVHGPRRLRRPQSRKTPRQGFFVGRSKELLFVYVEGAAIYLIDLLVHGSWTDQSLIETMHREWPEVLRPHRSAGIRDAVRVDGKTRHHMRKHAAMLTSVADGTVYFAPGGGAMCNGGSARALTASDRFLDAVERLEAQVHAAEDAIRGRVERAVGLVGELDLEFSIDDHGWAILRDRKTNVRLRTEFRLTVSGWLIPDAEARRAA